MTGCLVLKLLVSLAELGIVFFEPFGLLNADLEGLPLLSEESKERLKLAHALLLVFYRLFQALPHQVMALLQL